MSESKLGPNSLLLAMAGVFLAAYFIPWESGVVSGAWWKALRCWAITPGNTCYCV